MKENTAELLGKLAVVLLFAFVVRPLAIIYGLNILLEAIGVAVLPYTLLVYLGVMLVLLAIKVEVKINE